MYATRSLPFVLAIALLVSTGAASGQTEMGTAFTYQGQLTVDGFPVTDTCQFEFTLWDDPDIGEGNMVGGPIITIPTVVDFGLFTVALDFGTGVCDGDARYLQMAVMCSEDVDFDTLYNRQELTPAPYALYAETAGSVPDVITGGGTANYIPVFTNTDAIGNSVIYETGSGNVGIGTTSPAGKLDVVGTVIADGLTVDGAVGGSGFSGWDTNASNDLTTSTTFSGDVSGSYNSTQVANDSHSHTDSTVSDNLSVNNSRLYAPSGAGNVGIGTTSPSAKLEVAGTAKISGSITRAGNTVWDAGNDGSGSGLDADTLDGHDTSYFQRRVSGTCAAGSAIRTVNADGTVVCEADDVDDDIAACGDVNSCNYTGSIRHFQWMSSIYGTGDIYDNGYVKIQKINSYDTFRLYCGHSYGCTYVYYFNGGSRTAGNLSYGGTVNIDMGGDGNDARFIFAKRWDGMDMLVCDVMNTNYPYMHFICHDTK